MNKSLWNKVLQFYIKNTATITIIVTYHRSDLWMRIRPIDVFYKSSSKINKDTTFKIERELDLLATMQHYVSRCNSTIISLPFRGSGKYNIFFSNSKFNILRYQ